MSEGLDDFFEGKRPWSHIKDEVLHHYMNPYLAKVNRLKQPILLIDGYAGPGVFDDGTIGSPLIICEKAESRVKGNYKAIFIMKFNNLWWRFLFFRSLAIYRVRPARSLR